MVPRRLEFGVFPVPQAVDAAEITELVQEADRLGIDLVGIQDHPYQRRFLDTMALLAYLAGVTSRVRLFPDVANLPLRAPAMLAKEAASIDVLSGGRFELGLGAGSFWEAIGAMGGPVRSPGEAVSSLEEAIRIIRMMWSGERGLQFEGEHYSLSGVHSGPLPAHPIEIWIGGYGPRMLRLIGRQGDGWLPSAPGLPPDQLPERHHLIDEAARDAGRDPSAIRRLLNVSGLITDGKTEGFLNGPAEQWVEELTDLATSGRIDTFIFWPAEAPLEQLRRLTEVIPEVRLASKKD